MTQSPLYESPLLTTELGLSQYLKEEGRGPTSVQALSGGTANYVYRVTWNADATTVICKHAAAFLSSNNNFVFDSARMDYEAHALKHISPLQDQSTTERVHAVQVYEYDPDAKLLTIEDGGKHNLKEAYVDGSLNIQDIACDLATWLATLHMRSRGFSLNLPSESPASGKGNNPIAVAIYRHSYGNLHLALSKFGHDTSLATRVNDEYGSRLAQDNECLVHGDFWPGNVLVQPDVLMDSNGTRHDRLTIVDWEVRTGTWTPLLKTTLTPCRRWCDEAPAPQTSVNLPQKRSCSIASEVVGACDVTFLLATLVCARMTSLWVWNGSRDWQSIGLFILPSGLREYRGRTSRGPRTSCR